MFTRASHHCLSVATSIQSIPSKPIFVAFILILSSHLRLKPQKSSLSFCISHEHVIRISTSLILFVAYLITVYQLLHLQSIALNEI
jgi:hypothetical protein